MDASWAEGSSSSSLTIPPQWVYDVFVSFRGADTRKKFAAHLFAALKRNGFNTFRDDKKLERGEFINDGLLKAIEGSRMSHILFSENYAESRWCLDELVKIMDCRRTLKQIVVPIFYNVEPSDVQNQKGVLKEAFAKHLRECSNGDVKKWRAALKEAGNLPGLTLSQANGDEAKLIKMIIKGVREKVNPTPLYVPDEQVGLELRVGELKELLKLESDYVCIIAIWGMGGIGKTTIATRLYNDIQHKFERKGFLENVRETWQLPKRREELQKELLWAILKKRHEVRNFREGIEDIKMIAFHGKRVLLVLDDVDDVEQLEALAIDRKYFGPGSRIIITTRNMSCLSKLEVDETYEPMALNGHESLEIFSRHAFNGERRPKEDYLELSWQIVHYAGGLPLALKVLGSYLRGKSIHEWESEIEKLGSIPNDNVQEKLKLSFDSLSNDVKELFLDVSCFFVGKNRDFTVKVLDQCKKFAEIGFRDLADRCLIRFDHDKILMHDMLRDMGRDIVKQESLDDPGKRSRLWNPKDVLDVLRYGMGTEKVKGLLLNASNVQVNADPLEKMNRLWHHENVFEDQRDGKEAEAVNGDAFKKMDKLWLLHLDYFHLNTGYEQISRKLLWLSWKGFPLKCVPRNLSMEELVALDLRYSSLKYVWSGKKTLHQLKFLYLSHCHYLIRTPDFSGLHSLEELLLDDCISLVEVDNSIRCLDKLLVLDMRDCTNLQKIPFGIWMLKSLKHLDLLGCSNLNNASLKGVYSIGSSLITVQTSSCLTKLNLKCCNLSYLPAEIGNLISLQYLDLWGNNLSTLPDTIGRLTSLNHLDVSRNNLCTLPDTIGKLSHLTGLAVGYNKLSYLPSEIGDLDSLEFLNLEYNDIDTLPNRLCALVRLYHLNLAGCKLSHLPSGMGRLISLEFLDIEETNLRTLPEIPCLKVLGLKGCAEILSLAKLPKCFVLARDCASLQSLPLELEQIPGGVDCQNCGVDCQNCPRLAENNFVSRLLKQAPKSKGLSKLRRVVELCVPIGGETPILFPYKGRGPTISFVVPPSEKQKMVGWVLRIILRDDVRIRRVICNKIEKTGFHHTFRYYLQDRKGDMLWLLYIPHGKLGLQLQGGDEVEIPIEPYNCGMIERYNMKLQGVDEARKSVALAPSGVKCWAIDLVYEADDENRRNGIWNKVVSI